MAAILQFPNNDNRQQGPLFRAFKKLASFSLSAEILSALTDIHTRLKSDQPVSYDELNEIGLILERAAERVHTGGAA